MLRYKFQVEVHPQYLSEQSDPDGDDDPLRAATGRNGKDSFHRTLEDTNLAGGSASASRARELSERVGERFSARNWGRAGEILAEVCGGLTVDRRAAFEQRHNTLVTAAVTSRNN